MERLSKYTDEMDSCRKEVEALSARAAELEGQLREAQYHEKEALYEREREFEKEKAALRTELEEKASRQQEKSESEIERLRTLLAQAQDKIFGTQK